MLLKANYILITLIVPLIHVSQIESATLSITNVYKDQRHPITTTGALDDNAADSDGDAGEEYNIRVHVKNLYIALPPGEKNTTAIKTILRALGLPSPQQPVNASMTYTLVIDNIYTMVDEDESDYFYDDDAVKDSSADPSAADVAKDAKKEIPKFIKVKSGQKLTQLIKKLM